MPPPSPSPAEEEGSTAENYVQVANVAGQSSGQEVLGGARVSAAAAAAETRPTPVCSVCAEPWSCSGAHRICCIPCGHVYGRSCLEKCLAACGNTSSKCPQCGAGFKHEHIINIHAPGALFDGCPCLQEVEAQDKKIAEFIAGFKELLLQHLFEEKSEISKSEALVQTAVDVNQPLAMLRSMWGCKSRHYMDLAQLVYQNLNGLREADPKWLDGMQTCQLIGKLLNR